MYTQKVYKYQSLMLCESYSLDLTRSFYQSAFYKDLDNANILYSKFKLNV